MRRRFLFALLTAALLFPVAVTTVSAANPADCSNFTQYNDWSLVNVYSHSSVNKERGIRATMAAPYRIFDCVDLSGVDPASGPQYWVSLIPYTGGTENQILQIGVIKCDGNGNAACSGEGAHLFWAYGGCNGYTPTPRDLGPAPTSGAEFSVSRHSDGYYHLAMNLRDKATIYKGDAGIACWADTGTIKGQIACERWDSGDACGLPTDKVSADGIKYQVAIGGGWYSASLSQSLCHVIGTSEQNCDVIDTDSVKFWTVQ